MNLKINRVFFESVKRLNGDGNLITIDDSEIRQISGRAGRFQTDGYCGCFNSADLPAVEKALKPLSNVRLRKDLKVQQYNSLEPQAAALNSSEAINSIEEESKTFETMMKTKKAKGEMDFLMEKDEKEGQFENQVIIEEDKDPKVIPKSKKVDLLGRKLKPNEREIVKAAIFPSYHQIEIFAMNLERFEGSRSNILIIFKRFVSICQIEKLYFLQNHKTFIFVSIPPFFYPFTSQPAL